MAAPWLDSLSEDWNSEPASSPSSLPTFGTPSASTRSRIPRYSYGKNSTAGSRGQRRGSVGGSVNKRALSERSVSEINLPIHSSSAGNSPAKPTFPRRASTTSATSSDGSVVKHDSVTRKVHTVNNRTPDWKKFLLKGDKGPAAQGDLFSPKRLGLESLFQKPLNADSEVDMKTHKPLLPVFQGLDSFPSSPPPWPSIRRAPQFGGFSSFLGDTSQAALDIVPEQDEAEGSSATGASHDHDPSSVRDVKSGLTEESPHKNQAKGISWIPQGGKSSDPASSNDEELDDMSNLNERSELPQERVTAPPARSSKYQASADGSSSTTGGFSPVNIMKYNTQDGRVDYAAVDTSDPDSAELLKSCIKSASVQTGQPELADSASFQTGTPNTTHAYNQDPRMWTTSRLPNISPYVTIERGGHSDEDSFRHRSLSSADPSSNIGSSSPLGPSDSVSQVHTYVPNAIASQPRLVSSDSTSQVFKNNLHAVRNQPHGPIRNQEFTFMPPVNECDGSLSSTAVDNQLSPNRNQSSPLKIFGRHDTITNARLASRMEQMTMDSPQTSTETSRHNGDANSIRDTVGASEVGQGNTKSSDTVTSAETIIRRSISPDEATAQSVLQCRTRPNTPPAFNGRDLDMESHSKRPNSVLSAKDPTPKRRRTLGQGGIESDGDYVSAMVEGQTKRLQAAVVIGKRKDARYDHTSPACDPEELARRDILRPRNPTPAQLQMIASMGTQASSALSELNSIQQSIHEFPLPDGIEDEDRVRALAVGVATIRLTQRSGDSARKVSYSTQEYVAEAMNLMNLLRSRATGDLETLEEREVGFSMVEEEQNRSISRPPSREGVARGWRSRDDQQRDPQIVAALAKYQETCDESFFANSYPNSEHTEMHKEGQPDAREEDEQEGIRIRITEPPQHDGDTASPNKTQSSNRSLDSNRTINTSASQRSRTVHITPEMVTHLIQDNRAGMRFDEETMRWVRTKKPERDADQSSSTGTDPFHDVSDLEVRDVDILRQPIQATMPRSLSSLQVPKSSTRRASASEASGSISQQSVETRETSLQSSKPQTLKLEIDESSLVDMRDQPTVELDAEDFLWQSEDDEDTYEDSTVPKNSLRLSPSPSSTVRSKRQHASSLQSSPLQQQYLHFQPERNLRFEESEIDTIGQGDDSIIVPTYRQPHRPPQFDRSRHASSRQVSTWRELRQNLDTSQLHEHQEISFIETRPDGRTFSLTCAASTPFPARRTMSRQIVPSSGLRNMIGMTSLSELSDFSAHQDDARHVRARNLSGESRQASGVTMIHSPPGVASQMISRITDAEPNQTDWEFIEELDLKVSTLESLYLLDELCPRLRALEASSNALKTLTGAPPNIRELKVPHNGLSQTTYWGHMSNLQYLDVSNNELESLSGLTSLVHLRDLCAANNRISDFDSILDLDGLLSINLEGNCLARLDFSGNSLSRLTKLNLARNRISEIHKLHCLPSLEEVDLSQNDLQSFLATEASPKLKELKLSKNALGEVDVSRFPALEKLFVDDNCLTQIAGLTESKSLHTLSACGQRLPDTASVDGILADSMEITHLYLSGNALPSFPTLSPDKSYLSLQTLEVHLCGIHSLPRTFSIIFPNIRSLNLSLNPLKDIKPLRAIKRLRALDLSRTRIHRLRRTISNLSTSLESLDLSDTPLTLDFYPGAGVDYQKAIFHQRMDDETKLRFRVYGLMLATKCPSLKEVDSQIWDRKQVLEADRQWKRLVDLGIVEVWR